MDWQIQIGNVSHNHMHLYIVCGTHQARSYLHFVEWWGRGGLKKRYRNDKVDRRLFRKRRQWQRLQCNLFYHLCMDRSFYPIYFSQTSSRHSRVNHNAAHLILTTAPVTSIDFESSLLQIKQNSHSFSTRQKKRRRRRSDKRDSICTWLNWID